MALCKTVVISIADAQVTAVLHRAIETATGTRTLDISYPKSEINSAVYSEKRCTTFKMNQIPKRLML